MIQYNDNIFKLIDVLSIDLNLNKNIDYINVRNKELIFLCSRTIVVCLVNNWAYRTG